MKKAIIVSLVLLVVTVIAVPSIYRAVTFQPEESDVVYRYGMVKNRDKLDVFQKEAAKGKENHIRVVIYYEKTSDYDDDRIEEPEGHVIYDIKSKYDKNAKQGWLEVKPTLSFRHSEDENKISAMKIAQQCGSIEKDEKHGVYVLQECHDAYNYELVPIKN
ncbi:hypothetical protein CN918_28060 [Priestia megaterium]|nr:hypothetical protein CN918_28060 [Priestia megaterium]